MYNGKLKLVDQVMKGDVLSNGAKVRCVIRTKVTKGKKPMVHINGMTITNWHPILNKGIWVFPCLNFDSLLTRVKYVYNFVLDKHHIIRINNIDCCTLGHGFNDNDVIAHPYYGTNKIIEDLMEMDGWEEGYINIDDSQFIRTNNYVIGIKH